MERYFLIFIFLTIGLITVVMTTIADESTSKTKDLISKSGKAKRISPIDRMCKNLAKKLAPHIRMSDYSKAEMKALLTAAQINMKPEEYMADCIVPSVLFAVVFGIAFYFIWPILSIIAVIFSIILFRQKLDVANKAIEENRKAIEAEMPNFIAITTNHFKFSHDPIPLLKKYRITCCQAFRTQIDITLTDMETGNAEVALLRLDNRVHCKTLSQIIRGMLSVIRGDSQDNYFEQLQTELKTKEKERFRKYADEQPKKLKKYQYILLFSFLAAVLYSLISQVTNITAMF